MVQGANDTAPSASIGSFVIDAVKPGLTTTSGLMHVHGEMLNAKKHGNLLSSGKSLDGWPLSGVMFREPKTGLVGSGVMARWAEQQKPGARA